MQMSSQKSVCRVTALIVGLVFSLLLSPSIFAVTLDRIVAKVNAEVITLMTLEDKVAIFLNQMKDAGILISIDGPDHNVLKIKPPMVFNLENANELVINLKTIFDKNYDS